MAEICCVVRRSAQLPRVASSFVSHPINYVLTKCLHTCLRLCCLCRVTNLSRWNVTLEWQSETGNSTCRENRDTPVRFDCGKDFGCVLAEFALLFHVSLHHFIDYTR